jgi:transcription elongation factor GreA
LGHRGNTREDLQQARPVATLDTSPRETTGPEDKGPDAVRARTGDRNTEQGDIVTDTSVSVTWLTQEAYDRLRAELDHLTGDGRTDIAKKIEAAREEGDLKENGGYHAAKEEQGKQEARIRQLTQLLEHAKVGEPPADDGVVEPGMVVTADITGEKEVFLLGSREAADDSLEVYSEKSPLGTAIMGLKTGDTTTYTAPSGKAITVKILKAKPYSA